MDRSGRIERVLRRMAADGADTLVALSNARHSMARPDVATHLSGFRSLGESALVLFGDGTARLIVTPAYDEDRAAARRPDLSILATDDLAAALAQGLAGGGAKVARIATTGIASLPHPLAARVMGGIGKDGFAMDDAVSTVTAPKTGEEIARARKAAEIAEQGMDH